MDKQEQKVKAPVKHRPVPKTSSLRMLEDFEAADKIKEQLSQKLKLRGFQDPKKTAILLGPNLFMVLRDMYLEVDPEGDFTSFVTHYQKESCK